MDNMSMTTYRQCRMPPPRKAPRKHVWLAEFADDELRVIVDNIDTQCGRDHPPADLLGALVLAARGLPPEVIDGLMPAYRRRERKVLGLEGLDPRLDPS